MVAHIINDVGADVEYLRHFGVGVLDTDPMTKILKNWEGWSRLATETTRIIFPGNGAVDVVRTFGIDWFAKWSVDHISASRFWYLGENPVAVVGLALSRFDFRTENVVIIDDVISSGATIQKVREKHEVWIPRAKWHALSWVVQRSAKQKGFCSVYGAEIVGTQSKKDPINSLSTLLRDEKILQSYVENNIQASDRVCFFEVIHEIRRQLV